MRESDVVKMLDQFLEANGWVSFPQNSHVRHGRTRYKNGTPDILAMSPSGKFFGFEVKLTPDSKVSYAQKETLARLNGKVGSRGIIVAPAMRGLCYREIGYSWVYLGSTELDEMDRA